MENDEPLSRPRKNSLSPRSRHTDDSNIAEFSLQVDPESEKPAVIPHKANEGPTDHELFRNKKLATLKKHMQAVNTTVDRREPSADIFTIRGQPAM
jgi:hypothetical protein